MAKSSQNHIDLFSHARYREFMMQESLENLVELSLSMSRPCPPDCLRVLSITAAGENAGEGNKLTRTGTPRSLPARHGY